MGTYSSEGQLHLGLHHKMADQQGKGEDCLPLLCSFEVPLAVLHSALGPPEQKIHGTVGADPGEAMWMIRGLECLSCEGRPKGRLVPSGEGSRETSSQPSTV